MTITRIDRRPAIGTVPFHDTYIAELEQEDDARGNNSWAREVDVAAERIRHAGGHIKLIGVW